MDTIILHLSLSFYVEKIVLSRPSTPPVFSDLLYRLDIPVEHITIYHKLPISSQSSAGLVIDCAVQWLCCGCAVVAVPSWLCRRGCAVVAVPSWLCRRGCAVVAVPSWLCRRGCAVVAVPSWLCRRGCAVVAVPSWLCRRGCAVVAVPSWLCRRGCAVVAVPSWLCRRGCAVVPVSWTSITDHCTLSSCREALLKLIMELTLQGHCSTGYRMHYGHEDIMSWSRTRSSTMSCSVDM